LVPKHQLQAATTLRTRWSQASQGTISSGGRQRSTVVLRRLQPISMGAVPGLELGHNLPDF